MPTLPLAAHAPQECWLELLGEEKEVCLLQLSTQRLEDFGDAEIEALLCDLAWWWHSNKLPPMTQQCVTDIVKRM